MGYAVLHLEKAKGADGAMSTHIERTVHPKNADRNSTCHYPNKESKNSHSKNNRNKNRCHFIHNTLDRSFRPLCFCLLYTSIIHISPAKSMKGEIYRKFLEEKEIFMSANNELTINIIKGCI